MGMFDTFENKHDLTCPHCQHTYQQEDGIQSKNFESLLDYFHIGDVVERSSEIHKDYDWCPKCDKQLDVYLAFKDEIYIGSFSSIDEAKSEIKHFDLLTHYKELNHSYRKLEDEHTHICNTLSSIVEFNSTPKDKHSKIKFLLRFGVTDYNPIKAIKQLLEFD